MSSLVSYGTLRPSFIGALAVVFRKLYELEKDKNSQVKLLPVEEIVSISDSGIWGEESIDQKNDFRVFRVSDFRGDFILDLNSAPLRSIPKSKQDKYRLQPGDLLVVKSSGSAKQVVSGRIAVFPGSEQRSYAASNFLLRLRVKPCHDSRYIAYALGSPPIREIIADTVKTMTYPNISYKLYRQLTIPILPKKKQQSIANFFDALFFQANLLTLPEPLVEQRQIVVEVERLADKVEAFQRLLVQVHKNMDALIYSIAHRHDMNMTEKKKRGWREVTLGDVLTQVSDPVDVVPGKKYPHFGIYSFAKGLFKKPDLSGDSIKAAKLHRVHSRNFIYARLNAYEGAFGIVTDDFNEHYVSNEFPTFECSHNRVLPEFLYAYFQSPKVWEDIKRIVTGIGGGAGNRRIRLKEKIFLSLKIFLPPIDWQRKIKTIMEKLNTIKYEQEKKRLIEDALLPSILDKAFKGEL